MRAGKICISAGREETVRRDIIDGVRCQVAVEEALRSRGFSVERFYLEKDDFEDEEAIKRKMLTRNPTGVFNLFEGFSDQPQKEAAFVKILEGIGIPFTGNSSYALDICLDKERTKRILRENGIPTPKGTFVRRTEDLKANNFAFPLFVKPCFEDASLGIKRDSLVAKEEYLYKTVKEKLQEFPSGLLIEEFISGKEYNVGLLGDFPYEVLGIAVIDYARYKGFLPFLTYDSKWEMDSQEFEEISPDISGNVDGSFKKMIIDISKKVGKTLRCRGYFRVDLREKDGEPFVLDVNPNPDINTDSGFMKQAYYRGYTYEDIIERIVMLAEDTFVNEKLCSAS